MKKLSFLSFCLIAILSFVGCTKDDAHLLSSSDDRTQGAFTATSSQWTTDADFTWEDEPGAAEPNRKAIWGIPDLTQDMIDKKQLLLYAKSNVDGSVQPVPSVFTDPNSDKADFYHAEATPGAVSFGHKTTVAGVHETPSDANGISFRYIIVTPTNSPNNDPALNIGMRIITLDDLQTMSYEDVVSLLGIQK
ncbi:MAG TPA: hypothetical protein VM871_07460 [Flavisolibacter sp.]|jgi:hypothetical protein|nr:hypothetical protein [Flavisolibacter sp.]